MADLSTLPDQFCAIIIGASGGIGGALYAALSRDPRCGTVIGLSRSPDDGHGYINLYDETSIADAVGNLMAEGPFHLIISATGMLHDDQAGISPEKTWRHLDPQTLAHVYAANCIAPSMAAKHFLPLLAKKEKSVFAALSARVGSIADNRVGGWHSYRAAKAALNMMIRNFSIEMKLKSPSAIVVGLHPGTVATGLSAPFRGNVAHDIFTPDQAATHLLEVVQMLTPDHSGNQYAWDGAAIPG